MDNNKKDFFWPSYVDLMTALFAVALVLFVFIYYVLNKEKADLEKRRIVLEKEAALLHKVQANLKLFEKDRDIFFYNKKYNRIELLFQIQFYSGFDHFDIAAKDINGYDGTVKKLDSLGVAMKRIIENFKHQKETDTTMKDISYLMVISGSASHLRKDDDSVKNDILSYERALYLYKHWKDKLGIDFDSKEYRKIIELQISGMGLGGLGRENDPYDPRELETKEKKNQRFIISIAPKISQ